MPCTKRQFSLFQIDGEYETFDGQENFRWKLVGKYTENENFYLRFEPIEPKRPKIINIKSYVIGAFFIFGLIFNIISVYLVLK